MRMRRQLNGNLRYTLSTDSWELQLLSDWTHKFRYLVFNPSRSHLELDVDRNNSYKTHGTYGIPDVIRRSSEVQLI